MSTSNEQRAVEAMGCEREGDQCVTHFHRWEFCDWSRCARALAAAVTAEREKVLAIAAELQADAEESEQLLRDVGIDADERTRHETEAMCGYYAARRIREVSR